MSYEKIEKWFTTDLKLLKKYRDNPCTHIVLFHSGSKKASVVTEIDVPLSDIDTSVFVVKVFEAAQEDARGQARSGPQSYYIRLRFGKYMFPGRCMFRLMPESGADDDGYDDDGEDVTGSEPPTSTGQVAMAMRHVEAVMRLHVLGQAQVQNSLIEQNKILSARAEQGDRKFLEALQLFAELTMQQAKDEQELKRLENESKRKDIILEKMGVLVGPIATKLLGTGEGAQQAALASIGPLVESLDGEQMRVLMNTLRPEQMMSLQLLVEAYQKQQEGTKKPEPTKGAEG